MEEASSILADTYTLFDEHVAASGALFLIPHASPPPPPSCHHKFEGKSGGSKLHDGFHPSLCERIP
jgi:hypothetical protein